MATKKIKFPYFKACLVSDPNETVNLLPYLEKMLSANNIYSQEISCSSSTYVSVNKIERHDSYQLSSGAFLPFPVWELRFPRSRVDVPGKIDITTRKISAISLNDNERIVEETVILYDPETDIVIIEKNGNGASVSNIKKFINNFVDDETNYIDFAPMVNEHRLHQSLAQKASFSINIRLTNTNDPEFIEEINSSKNESVKKIVATANSISIPSEYAVKAEFYFSITNNRSHKNSFILNEIHSIIHTLYPLIKSDKVDKFILKGITPDTDKVQEIDLIDDIIHDEFSFSVNQKNRYITSIAIFDKMALKYSYRRPYYTK